MDTHFASFQREVGFSLLLMWHVCGILFTGDNNILLMQPLINFQWKVVLWIWDSSVLCVRLTTYYHHVISAQWMRLLGDQMILRVDDHLRHAGMAGFQKFQCSRYKSEPPVESKAST